MKARTNSSGNLDKLAIYAFVVVFFLSGTVLGYKIITKPACEEVLFSINATDFRAGELIRFRDNTEGAENWNWDFGDSTDLADTQNALHMYETEGKYRVRLMVNGVCEETKYITIKEKIKVIDSTRLPVFILPEEIRVGQKLKVEDKSEIAQTWEWRFGENASVDAKTRKASYSYKEPGIKTVSLVINDDVDYILKKKITVLPRYEEKGATNGIGFEKKKFGWNVKDKPKSAEKKEKSIFDRDIKDAPEGAESDEKEEAVPFISNENFEKMLLQVSEEQLKPQAFRDYLCGDLNKPMVVNGKTTTFLILCEKISGKNIKFKKVNLIRGPGSNCVNYATIEYKKKLF